MLPDPSESNTPMDRTGMLARKSVAQTTAARPGDAGMRKTLGVFSIVAIGVGAIIGAGIFVLTGTAAARYAGPAIMLSFVLGGIVCALVGLCYAELAAMLPVSGSTYSYTYATLGEVFAWMIGWDLVLEYAMGAATVAVGWSGYATSLLKEIGIPIPAALTEHVNLPAAAIVGLLTLLLVAGTKESTRLNNVMVAVKLTVVVAFIAVGAFFVDPAHWHPLIPANKGEFGHFGPSGILRGAGIVFFAYIGFDAVSTAAQEARNPQRDMPAGILGALAISTVLYIAVAAIMTGIVPYDQLNVPDPIAKAVDVIGQPWFSVLIKIGALTGLTTVILVLLYGQTRIFFTMAEDGLLPGLFAYVSPKRGTPVYSQLTIGALVALVAAFVPIDILGEMVSIGTLCAFILVCAAILYLRRSDPATPRPFRVPAVPWVPIAGILVCLLLMAGFPGATWLRLVIWMAIGLVVYVSYGRRHSVLQHGT